MNVSHQQLMTVEPKPDEVYCPSLLCKNYQRKREWRNAQQCWRGANHHQFSPQTIKNTSMNHTGALGNICLHYHEHCCLFGAVYQHAVNIQ